MTVSQDWREPVDTDATPYTNCTKPWLQGQSLLAIMHTHKHSTQSYTHSYGEQQGQRSGQQKQMRKEKKQGGCVRANKKVRLDWNVSPTSICETLHCRGSWTLVAGPDKSLWSLMFVSDRGWVHNRLETRGHDIHLPAIGSSNTVRVIASARHLQHAAKAHFTKLTCPSFLSFCYCTMCLGNGFKVQSSILTESAASNAYKCLLVRTAQAIKCQWLFWGKWHTNVAVSAHHHSYRRWKILVTIVAY